MILSALSRLELVFQTWSEIGVGRKHCYFYFFSEYLSLLGETSIPYLTHDFLPPKKFCCDDVREDDGVCDSDERIEMQC